jgi:hypothetical protein
MSQRTEPPVWLQKMRAPWDKRLMPNHLEDLRASGLTDSTIQSWGCFSVTAEDASLLKNFAKDVNPPGLALPILSPASQEPNDFSYKPDNPRVMETNGKLRTCKYEMPRKTLNQIHVPRASQWLFRRPDGVEGPRRMVITEGQKKGERAAQDGIGCIVLPGVWNWFIKFGEESIPLAQLALIEWPLYTVEICFDSDALHNAHVRRAELALAQWLKGRGASKVSIVRLPSGGDGGKVGLDDYLIQHSVAAFEALPRVEQRDLPLDQAIDSLSTESTKKQRTETLARILIEEPDPSERTRLLKMAASKTGIPLRDLRKSAEVAAQHLRKKLADEKAQRPLTQEDVDRIKQERHEAVEAILEKSYSTPLGAQCCVGNELIFVCSFGGAAEAVVLSSNGDVVASPRLPERLTISEMPNRSPVSAQGVRRFAAREPISAKTLFDDLQYCFKRHAVFKDSSVATILALWVMGTYCYCLFNYFGYLWFTSLGPSHGKSLVEKLISMLSFNATQPITVPTPASLFRETDVNRGTLVLDEIENLDAEKKGDVIAILNAGFERGGVVQRCELAGDRWTIREFGVYCPKAIAGISTLPRTLNSRVFQIEMPKKKETEKIDSFEPDRLAPWAEETRDDLARFALMNTGKILELYQGRSELVPRSINGVVRLDDRLRDILAPLYVVAAVIDLEAGALGATADLERFAAIQAGARRSDPAGDEYALAAHLLFDWAASRWREDRVLIQTSDAINLFRSGEIDWATDSAGAKSLLRKLGGINSPTWWGDESARKTTRGYVFRRSELQDIVERHPITNQSHESAKQKR